MPIVDGLTSTKMIRSYEKTTPSHALTKRAALNGRIPVIAVSASLVERERQIYIDAGFDAWILKPISFDRLQELLTGIVDAKVREDCLYKPGNWEKGGWFDKPLPDAKFQAKTKPDGDKIPPSLPSEGLKSAASSGDPDVTGVDGVINAEQARLRKAQREEKVGMTPKSASAPGLTGGSAKGVPAMKSVTGKDAVGTPEPMDYAVERPPGS